MPPIDVEVRRPDGAHVSDVERIGSYTGDGEPGLVLTMTDGGCDELVEAAPGDEVVVQGDEPGGTLGLGQ